MSLLKGKFARISAAGLSATALVVALVAPTTVLGESVTLHRCSTLEGDATCLSNVQVSVPIAAQLASQSARISPSAESDQSNTSRQSTDNSNKGFAVNALSQDQKSVQVGADQSIELTASPKIDSSASIETTGGKAVAIGPNAVVDFHLSQESDASVKGNATAVSDTGNAGGGASASGSIDANGGNANGHANAEGGNGNGNSKAVDVAKQIKSGNALASTDASAGDGGNARSSTGEATGRGGSGGDGGNANSGLNGNGTEATSIAASIAATLSGDDPEATADSARAGAPSNKSGSGYASGGDGGNGAAGNATSGGSGATGGAGGAASNNSSDANPVATNSSGDASSTSSGNNGNAAADGRGGTGGAANGNGNTAITGGTNVSGMNATDARLVGGSSQNILGVSFTQTGAPTAKGGEASNTGSATSSPSVTTNQTANNSNPQTATTSQTGTTGANSNSQDAHSSQAATNSNDATNRALGRVAQKAGGTTTSSSEPSNSQTP